MARLALVSDQHGNDVAFRAAIDEIEHIGVDQIVCLGDAVQGGTQPVETLERLDALGCPTVLGNADAFLLDGQEGSAEPVTERQLEVRAWTLEQLSPRHREQIDAFESVVTVVLAGVKIVCFHGSPAHYEDILLPEVAESSLEPYLSALPADILAGGHTHRQWARRIGDALFVNPGSIGAPAQRSELAGTRLPLHAEYALVIIDELGPSVEFHQTQYSYRDLEKAAAMSGRPYWQELVAEFAAATTFPGLLPRRLGDLGA